MAAALPFLMIAGSVMSAIGAMQQGAAAKSAAEAQASATEAAASYNTTVATQNAGIARQNAADRALQSERETYLRLGSIRANQGASGGAAGEGSVLDVLGDVAAQSELEKQQIIYQGELQARGYRNDATLDTFSGQTNAAALRASGQTKQDSGYWKAGSELLSGGMDYARGSTRLTRS